MINRAFALAALAPIALLSACGLAPKEKLVEAQSSFAANDYKGAKVYLGTICSSHVLPNNL